MKQNSSLLALLLAVFGIMALRLPARAVSAEAKPQEEKVIVIDVRTPGEFAESHIVGALNMDVNDRGFVAQIQKLNKDRLYKIYCRSGHRAQKALGLMMGEGFTIVENIGGLVDAAKNLNRKCEGTNPSC